jgi:DNA repair protein RadC
VDPGVRPDLWATQELLAGVLSPRSALGRTAAAALLERFGTLRRLSIATPIELAGACGAAAPGVVRLAAAFALGRRVHAQRLPVGRTLRTSHEIFEAYHARMRDLRKERFVAVHLDAKNRLLREELISEGTLTASLVHPREVFGPAMREHTVALLLVHNHPSGDPEPSPEDHEVTRRLQQVGDLVGIRVVDHVVIGDGRYVSFLERGYVA